MSNAMRYGSAAGRGKDGLNYPLAVELGGTGSATVPGAFTVAATTVSGSSTAAGDPYNISQAAAAVTGYAPICVCGWSSSGMTYLSIANMYLDSSGNIHMSGRNLGSSAVTPSFSVRVLYGRTA